MEKEDLKADDLFVREPIKRRSVEENRKDQEIANKVEELPSIPSEYIPVKLSSLGKLGFPAVVHVRDYTFDEAIKIAEIDEENITETLVEILNSVIFEDVDIMKGHRQDILEILITIYGTWYSPSLENFKYFINLDLPENQKNQKENISVATIPINSIKTTPLSEEAKIPIKISKGDFEVSLSLPRVENEILASKFLEEKYSQEDNEISEVTKKVRMKENTAEEQKVYDELQKRKGKDFLRVAQSLLVESFKGKKLETISEKLEAINHIPLNVWAVYNNEIKKHFQFGVDPEVTFICSVNHKSITRRFQFREILFLPSMVQEDHSGFSISLG